VLLIETISAMKILKYTSFLIYAILAAKLIVDVLGIINYVTAPFWIDILRLIENTLNYLWERYSFVLASVMIFVNYGNLSKLNIDKSFLVLYAISGIIFSVYYFWPVGWLGLLFAGLIIYLLLKNKFNLEQRAHRNPAMIIAILVIVFCCYWLFKIIIVGTPAIDRYIVVFLTGSPFAVIEEVIFRGMLWMDLEASGWRHFRIVLVQALLFWILHIKYMLSDPFLFWVQLPIVGVFLGILVWRYKSISPSTVAHILLNLR
jgi:hypothetical protein